MQLAHSILRRDSNRIKGRNMRMNKPLVVTAAVLGVVFLVLACVYWFVPAGLLPHFMPGFVDGSSHVHVKHGLVAIVFALVLLGFSWGKREGGSIGRKPRRPLGAVVPLGGVCVVHTN